MVQPDINQILASIRKEVDQKRASGSYPPGLEQELEFEFAEIMKKAGGGDPTTITELKDLILSRIAIVDHLAMMVVELESRLYKLESNLTSD